MSSPIRRSVAGLQIRFPAENCGAVMDHRGYDEAAAATAFSYQSMHASDMPACPRHTHSGQPGALDFCGHPTGMQSGARRRLKGTERGMRLIPVRQREDVALRIAV